MNLCRSYIIAFDSSGISSCVHLIGRVMPMMRMMVFMGYFCLYRYRCAGNVHVHVHVP